ncbi:hypothetical protein [Kitasatospora sp. NPDC091276]|uniref:hypothetical protein n=1 Tax=Kitasatospora sp. NPDC091276 TaxID=3155300 RepID=UPI00344A2A60
MLNHVHMVEVDRSTMAPERVAAKFTAYRELFRTKVRDNDPALAEKGPADRTVHCWRRTWPGHTRAGYPPVALVVTDAGPVALANRQETIGDLSADCWRGRWCREVRDDNEDGWREYDDAVPIVATTLELLAEHGPLGPIWWRFGRPGRHSLIEALENPNNRAAYDLRQAAREDEEHQAHQEPMDSLACIDCGGVPEEESTWEYGRQGQVEWTRRPGGRCWPCHQDREERLEREAQEQLEAARTANAALRPCWTCRGPIGGKEGSALHGQPEQPGPDRLECPQCVSDREAEKLGPLVLPVPTKRELVAALVSAPADPWWEDRVLHAKLYPAGAVIVTCWPWWACFGLSRAVVWTFGWTCWGCQWVAGVVTVCGGGRGLRVRVGRWRGRFGVVGCVRCEFGRVFRAAAFMDWFLVTL